MSIYGHDCTYCGCVHEGRCEVELEAIISDLQNQLARVRQKIEEILLPGEYGIWGYGGPHPSTWGLDPYKPESWSDGHDYQHAALKIWEAGFGNGEKKKENLPSV